tara:strand:+ start:212 stop:907 length:696 start_codon:yes stop_codon:yes gene_type:complete
MKNSIPLESDQNWWWYRAKRNILDLIIQRNIKNENLDILEIGPGLGNNLKCLNKYGNLDVVEIDDKFLNYIKEKNNNLVNNFYKDISELNKEYDLIVLLDVVEHIEFPKRFLNNLNKFLKQDGKLIIGVPSLKFLWSKHDEELKHFNRYNWKELCDVCSSYKLKKKYGFNYLMILARYIQIKFTKNIHTTNETAYFTNEVLYFISRIEHILRKININPKKGISIIGLFSKI